MKDVRKVPFEFDGVRYMPATYALDVLDKPALVRWAARSVAQYVAKCVEAARERRMSSRALLDTLADIESLSAIPYTKKAQARESGNYFHHLIDDYAKGLDINVEAYPVEIRSRCEAFLKFARLVDLQVEYSEVNAFNEEHRYATRIDWIGTLNLPGRPGVRALIDWKSGDTYPEHHYQLMAGARCSFLVLDPQSKDREPMPEIGGIFVASVYPARVVLHEWPMSDEAYNVFLGCVLTRRALQAVKKPKTVIRALVDLAEVEGLR